MKFKRINMDTVRCILSEHELNENGLNMNDFLTNDGRTEEFIRKIISMAEQEVGFKAQGGPMSIQVAVLPDNNIALTFSEKQSGSILDLLENIKAAMAQHTPDIVKGLQQVAENAGALLDDTEEHAKKQATFPIEDDTLSEELIDDNKAYILRFTDLDAFHGFIRGTVSIKEIRADLYRMEKEDCYYLLVYPDGETKKTMCRMMSTATEYLEPVTTEDTKLAYVREHGRLIIKEFAIEKMQQLWSKQV